MKIFTRICAILLFGFLLITACKKKKEEPGPAANDSDLPELSTSSLVSITDVSAIGGGSVKSEGSSAITETGICWDTLPAPTPAKGYSKAAASGNYTCALTGLRPYTKYYVRAYAITTNGTAYGNELSFRSSDVWTKQQIGPAGLLPLCMKANGNKLYMGTNNGFFYSPDGGESWQSRGFANQNVLAIGVQETTIFAGLDNHAIYRSLDNGTTWKKVFTEIGAPLIADFLVDGNFIFASEYYSIYRSSDNGDTWTKTDPAGNNATSYLTLIKCSNVAYALSGNSSVLFKSNDHGVSWQTTSPIFSSGARDDFKCVDTTLVLATYTGLYYSDDRGNSKKRYTDIPAKPSCISVSGPGIFSATQDLSDLNLSPDKGKTWNSIISKGLTTISIKNQGGVLLCDKSVFIYSEYAGGGLYRYRR